MDACRYFAGLIIGALQGRSRDELVTTLFSPAGGHWAPGELAPEIEKVAAGSFLRREPLEIRGSGYLLRSLEAGLWALARSTTFADGALLAVNLGDDADTTGAVFGQLAGAHYGYSGIPERWLELLYDRQSIEDIARQIHASATERSGARSP